MQREKERKKKRRNGKIIKYCCIYRKSTFINRSLIILYVLYDLHSDAIERLCHAFFDYFRLVNFILFSLYLFMYGKCGTAVYPVYEFNRPYFMAFTLRFMTTSASAVLCINRSSVMNHGHSYESHRMR